MPEASPAETLNCAGRPLPSSALRQPLILELRQATASLHAGVEALPVMAALMAPTVTWDDYHGYLARMTQVYGSLEPGLFATLDEELVGHPSLNPALRPKLPALRADLRALGMPDPPLAPSLRPRGLSEAVGGLYVLEGATLGSRVIARHLRRHLKQERGDPLGPSAFLGPGQDSQAPSLSAAWRQFGALLETLLGEGRISRDGVVEGACGVFGRVHQILAGQLGPTCGR